MNVLHKIDADVNLKPGRPEFLRTKCVNFVYSSTVNFHKKFSDEMPITSFIFTSSS